MENAWAGFDDRRRVRGGLTLDRDDAGNNVLAIHIPPSALRPAAHGTAPPEGGNVTRGRTVYISPPYNVDGYFSITMCSFNPETRRLTSVSRCGKVLVWEIK